MRFLLSVFILLVAASLQTVLAVPLARAYLSIDLLLVCVVCCALQMAEFPLILAALASGVFKDCFSAGAFGQSVAVFLPIALVISRMRRMLWVGHWTTQAGLAFAATLCAWLLYGLFQWIGGQPADIGLGYALKQSALNAVVAPFLFALWATVLK